MKTLANCNPLEFLTQTNKIRRQAEKWLTLTKVPEIRRRMPEIDPEMTAEQKREAFQTQARENLSDILTAAMEEHPEETAELLCLLCFIDPKDMGDHSMTELLTALNEILANEEIMSFFTSLAQLGLTNTSTAAKA